ncbi:MAG TPA: hypothetical protein VE972_14685 [Conexibacter sp.]|nr:hypothetical protein [Conexibacter sp.]
MTQAPPTPLPDDSAAPACRRCSGPLAADQRYCLSCGARVATPRVDYLDVLAGGVGAAPAAAGRRHPRRSFAHQLERVGGPMGAAAVVLVALGVGFLLGQGSASTPATQVVRPIVNVTNRGGTAPADSGTTSAANGSGGGAKHGKKGSGDAGTKGIAPVTQDKTGGDITKLKQQSDEQATGGKPPPKDHKASGGGTPTDTIG